MSLSQKQHRKKGAEICAKQSLFGFFGEIVGNAIFSFVGSEGVRDSFIFFGISKILKKLPYEDSYADF